MLAYISCNISAMYMLAYISCNISAMYMLAYMCSVDI